MPEPLLLIPGLMCTAALFGPQIEALSGGREVLVADHMRASTMPGIARQILDDAPERFALAGLSMGVYLSLEIMHQAPQRVTRLALLDGKAAPDTPEITALRRRQLQMADAGRFLDITTEMLAPRLVAEHRAGDVELFQIIVQMAEDTGEAAYRRQMAAIMTRDDYRPMLAGIEVPTLVLTGALDVITPPEFAMEMAGKIGNSKLVILPGSGHLSTLEVPFDVNGQLRGWLALDA